MKLIIVRHGETFANVSETIQGHLNSQLTPNGIEQTKKVSERLKDVHIDIAFSSDLDRAVHTCKEILKHHKDTELITTPILREQAKGIFEGKSRDGRDGMLKKKNIKFHEWSPEGGERLIDVWEKVVPFIEKLKKDYSGKTVLVVSHGGPISCILSYLHDKKIENFRDFLPRINTAISIVNFSKKGVEFETINCSKHL